MADMATWKSWMHKAQTVVFWTLSIVAICLPVQRYFTRREDLLWLCAWLIPFVIMLAIERWIVNRK